MQRRHFADAPYAFKVHNALALIALLSVHRKVKTTSVPPKTFVTSPPVAAILPYKGAATEAHKPVTRQSNNIKILDNIEFRGLDSHSAAKCKFCIEKRIIL